MGSTARQTAADGAGPVGFAPRRSRIVVECVLALALAAVASIPLILPLPFLNHVERPLAPGGVIVGLLIGAAVLAGGWRLLHTETPQRRVVLLILAAIIAAGLTELHRVAVDEQIYPGQTRDSTSWQRDLVDATLWRDGGSIPHVYRFLPMTTLALLERLTGSFEAGRWLYRTATTCVLLLWIFRFGRRFLGPGPALLIPLLYLLIYPVTIRLYAGQPTDPLSHLSFVLSFCALAAGQWGAFFVVVALGALAKESVVAMIGFYLLFHARDDPGWRWRLPLGIAAGLAALALPRMWMIDAPSGYGAVSGVDPSHVIANLAAWRMWLPQILFSVGVLAPFAVAGWSAAERMPRRLVLFLAPVLLGSGLVFSWLHEARNYVPLAIPLAVIAAVPLSRLPWPGRQGTSG